MIKAGIAGATGYVGIELVRILSSHPEVEIVYLASHSHDGQFLTDVFPHIHIAGQLKPLDAAAMADECDIVFSALPSGCSSSLAKPILDAGKKMIDLGADFRLKGSSNGAVYGLPEIVDKEKIRQANMIANPGCYPTCIALGAYPALAAGIIDTDGMIFDAKSGLSGAGRGLALKTHFCEASENFKAYDIAGSHRHNPEIEQVLGEIAGDTVSLQFTPHLLPMIRGLLTTAYLSLNQSISAESIWEIYLSAYQGKPFIKVHPLGQLPQTGDVRGSNYCHIGFQVDERTKKLIVVSVIDNLVKGASGQAVQNMNIMFDQPETKGLNHLCPIYP